MRELEMLVIGDQSRFHLLVAISNIATGIKSTEKIIMTFE